LTGPIILNNACVAASFNGEIDLNVSADPADLVPGQTYGITMTPSSAPFPLVGASAGNQSAKNLAPGTYSFTATSSTGCASTKSFTVLDAPVKSEIIAGNLTVKDAEYCTALLEQSARVTVNQLNIIGGGPENIADYQFAWTNVATSTVVYTAIGNAAANSGGDEFINVTTVPAGTVTKGSYSLVATKKTDLSGTGGLGCVSAAFTITISDKTISPALTLTPGGDTSCDPSVFEGKITILATTASGPGSAGTYSYSWTPNGGAG
jgi:hypothetical protein